MEAKHSWNGMPLTDCSPQELEDALKYGREELERIDAIDTVHMPVKRKDRLAKKRDEMSDFIAAAMKEAEARK